MFGAPIINKTKIQSTTAFSSTKAKFVAVFDIGWIVLFVLHILDDLGTYVVDATPIHGNNLRVCQMANLQMPTQRTKYIDIGYLASTKWTEQDFFIHKPIAPLDNNSDALTKDLGRQLCTRR